MWNVNTMKIFFSHKKQSHGICGKMDTVRDLHIKCNKPISQRQILHTCIFVLRFYVDTQHHVCNLTNAQEVEASKSL